MIILLFLKWITEMKKIPTLFLRNPENMSRVTEKVNPECAWVFQGQGYPTIKIDGTCCIIREGVLYKRRMVRSKKKAPDGFWLVDEDQITGKRFGWVIVGNGKEDRWHREAFLYLKDNSGIKDGTCELIGPKIQGNPYGLDKHQFVMHDDDALRIENDIIRSYSGIREWLANVPSAITEKYNGFIEGVVFHGGPNGAMAKIKVKDFC